MLEKLKAWFYSILSFGCMTLFALTGIAFLEWLEKMWYRACGNGLLEYCLKSLKSPGKVLEYKVIKPVWTMFNGIGTHDLPANTGAMLDKLSYEATHWEQGQFSLPNFFQEDLKMRLCL